jgi:hypothetical protein
MKRKVWLHNHKKTGPIILKDGWASNWLQPGWYITVHIVGQKPVIFPILTGKISALSIYRKMTGRRWAYNKNRSVYLRLYIDDLIDWPQEMAR